MILNARWTAGASRRTRALLSASAVALILAGCQVSEFAHDAPHLAPVPASLERKIERMGMDERSPILLRIFKQESALEVWKRDRSGRYQKLKEYEICAWSGKLGPKLKEGDRQAPEGFYTVSPAQMNPNSSYHLAFNLGFPNKFDRSHGRTGTHLMVHGDCSSRGCYAMEDEQIQEIYALAREAFRGGQQAFQVQAFPFRMTPQNMAKHADSEHLAFWEMLKKGSDHFEVTRKAPKVDVCGRRYVFNANADTGSFSPSGACPAYDVPDSVESLVAAKWEADLSKRKTLIAKSSARQEREERWEDREAAIATFFDKSRSGEDAADDAAPGVSPVAAAATAAAAASASASASGSVPIPRRSPIAKSGRGSQVARSEGGGIRLPNPFRRNQTPVASTSGVAAASAQPQPAAAPAQPAPAAAAASPQVETARAAQPQPVGEPAEPLAFAPPEEANGGFFSNVARGSRGFFKRAGSIFE